MDFLKSIAPYASKQIIKNEADVKLLKEISEGKHNSYKDIANTHFRGNVEYVVTKMKRIKNRFIFNTLQLDIYHNESQRKFIKVRIREVLVYKMLYLGFRAGAIDLAQSTYGVALKYHFFDVAKRMSYKLFKHYGQHRGNESKLQIWYDRYSSAKEQENIACEAAYDFTKACLYLRNNKCWSEDIISKVETAVDQMAQYKDEAESYEYWFNYYQLLCIREEIKGNFFDMLSNALDGYSYFEELPINHIDSKNYMISQIIHAYNLMGMYDEAAKYDEIIEDRMRANYQIVVLRLMKAFINLSNYDRAKELLEEIDGSHPEVRAKSHLYRFYCNGITGFKPSKEKGFNVGEKIALMYSDALKGDFNSHNDVLQYIRRKELKGTREEQVIKGLSAVRHKGYDEKKFSKIKSCIEALRTTPKSIGEVEVLDYSKMLKSFIG